MKKLLLLGGSRYLIPVIDKAHELGIYVITCDYLPDNAAHRHSDEYRDISIIDRDAVLRAAKEMNIDGVMSFACDPGVVTAAYVAQELGLPFQCSYEAATILQDKGEFRGFLAKNHFNTPKAKRYTDARAPFGDINSFTWPVMVKPVDSAGSKGVTRVDEPARLPEAIEAALNGSHSGAFMIEDFLSFEGYHSSTDPFTVDGRLRFITYSDQLFDPEADNPYTPARIIWPSTMRDECQDELTREIQRLMDLMHMRTGIYNIETCVASGGRPYIMEVSPRGGGCKIAELQRMAYGVDLIECEVRKAVGLSIPEIRQTECEGCWCELVVHARPGQSGIFRNMNIAPDIARRHVKLVDMSVKPGDMVHPFTGANMSLGDVFLRFDSRDELDGVMARSSEWLEIELA